MGHLPMESRPDGSLADHMIDLVAGIDPDARCRRMFGGWGVFTGDGRMFGIVMDGAVYLRVGERGVEDARDDDAAEDRRWFAYRRGERMVRLSYREVPSVALDSPHRMSGWARAAIAAARAAG